MKLLIADDDLTSRTILAAVTSKWGYEPVVVEDGEAAWQVLQGEDPPRLLLLDWMMPGLSGLELCRRVRERETSDPPFIILLTGRTETEDIVAALEAEANDHIAKPFDNSELQARLRAGQRMLDLQGELNHAKEALFIQATHDSLTGLLNRGAVMELLAQEMARDQRQAHILRIGLCDIDYFKRINDTYGHLAGDEILREFSRRLSSELRAYDQVGRYGGEEFLVVVTSNSEQTLDPFERLRRVIADSPFIVDDDEIEVTMSCGVATYSESRYADVNALIGAADAALYQAKDAGRNRTVLAKDSGSAPERKRAVARDPVPRPDREEMS